MLVLFSLSLWGGGGITLSESEYLTLKTALQMADEQLTKSETLIDSLQNQLKESREKSMTLQTECLNLQTECVNLQERLKTQDGQLTTLTMQLDSALESLSKLKRDATKNNVIIFLVGIAGLALGGSVVFLLTGGR